MRSIAQDLTRWQSTGKDKGCCGGEKPVYRLEREELGRTAKRAVIISEGLIVYLTAAEVCNLARDLAAPPSFHRWATDLCSPRLLTMLQKQVGSQLDQAGSPLKFAPEQGPAFFNECGWTPIDVRSMLQTAAELKRLPLLVRLFALFPDSKGTKPKQIWGGVVQLEKR
ncbi:MAG TPA: hypothetical protein VHX14_07825 [Thermoanaerobaculia bacterium]|nr:hypothetical protein [Thermoanaerobaculia bacterium]